MIFIKRFFSGFILLAILVVKLGCQNDSITLDATIIDIKETSLFVEANNRFDEQLVIYISQDTKIISEHRKKVGKENLKIGQKVIIYYNGLIATSNPGQITQCDMIEIKKE